jgi:hypothetical protein
MRRTSWVLALAAMICQPALADSMRVPRYRAQPWYVLPPERHVIEVVQPPWSGNFIINGRPFTGMTASCLRWAAGEPIMLRTGDWHGRCIEATFYNLLRRNTCRTWCG